MPRTMDRAYRFSPLLCLAFIAMSLTAWFPSSLQAASNRPNVVLIMLDDFGYECVGANGGGSYKTPVLDELAATGMRFEHCYVQPLCTPTRVQLMTGLYNIRNYQAFGQMDPNAVTFGNLFQKAGYATCIAGKWQLGRDVELPKKFGFDESYLWQHTRRPERYKNPGLEINGQPQDWTNGEYGPDIINQHAIDFINRKKDGPFFLYYPMILTHSPYVATPDSEDYDQMPRTEGKKKKKKQKEKASGTAAADRSLRHFADMVAYADKLVGQLVKRLDELQIRDNTLVIVLGDNGTGRGTRSILNGQEFIGGKGLMNHRGMHVPLIVSWPAEIKQRGRVNTNLIDSTDFLPTICEAAGIQLPEDIPFDGRSFCAQLLGQPSRPRDSYYCWYAPQGEFVGEFAASVRFKLYRDGRLFDLQQDAEEQSPISETSRTQEAITAASELQKVLDRYHGVRQQ